jgi:hypothetical protein
MIRNFLRDSVLEVDYVRARGRVFPEPMVTLGGEEAL